MLNEKLIILEDAEACIVLALREAVAPFPRRNTRTTKTDRWLAPPDDGDDHTSIGISTSFGK